ESLLVPHRGGTTETADQVRHGVAVLPHGHARQLDPRRAILLTRLARVIRLKHELRDFGRLVRGQATRIVIRHRLGDELGKLRELLLAGERMWVFLRTFARSAVAGDALLLVDLLAGPNVGREGQWRDRQRGRERNKETRNQRSNLHVAKTSGPGR